MLLVPRLLPDINPMTKLGVEHLPLAVGLAPCDAVMSGFLCIRMLVQIKEQVDLVFVVAVKEINLIKDLYRFVDVLCRWMLVILDDALHFHLRSMGLELTTHHFKVRNEVMECVRRSMRTRIALT